MGLSPFLLSIAIKTKSNQLTKRLEMLCQPSGTPVLTLVNMETIWMKEVFVDYMDQGHQSLYG